MAPDGLIAAVGCAYVPLLVKQTAKPSEKPPSGRRKPEAVRTASEVIAPRTLGVAGSNMTQIRRRGPRDSRSRTHPVAAGRPEAPAEHSNTHAQRAQ